MTIQGQLLLTWSHVWFAFVWMGFGAAATLLTTKRGIYIALATPILIGLFVDGVALTVDLAGDPVFHGLSGDINDWVPKVVLPFFASLIGGLLGELIRPSTGD